VDNHGEPKPERFWPESDRIVGTETRRESGTIVTTPLTVADLQRSYEAHRNRPRPHFLRLKISFTTAENLAELAKDSYSMNARAFFCDDWEGTTYGYLGFDSVQWRGMAIDGSNEARQALAREPKPQTFYFYANVRNLLPRYVYGVRQPDYDLRNDDRDVCFHITIPEYLLGSYRSNTVIIPHAIVAEALQHLPTAVKD
jgi:hypothetical protein